MTRRRVLHLIDTGGPGGAETVYLRLAAGLAERGWDSVLGVPEDDWLAAALRQQGLQPVHLGTDRALDLGFARRLRKEIRSRRVDLVQAHLLGSSVYASMACLGTRVPVVCTFHGQPDIPPGGRFSSLKTTLIGRRENRIVCVSHSLERYFRQQGFLTGDIHVIHNGVPLQAPAEGDGKRLRAELGIPADAPLFGAVGNIRRSKDYPMLIRAFAEVSRDLPDAHLLIAGHGDGPLLADLESLRRSLRLEGKVHLLGFREDVEHVLSTLDVYVLSSSDEGFSLALVQAMAAGLPIVATRCGGPEEIVGDSGGAVLVRPGDPTLLATEMTRTWRDPGLRRRLASRARERSGAFTVDAMVEGYNRLYQWALK